jgi:hypothetical protein
MERLEDFPVVSEFVDVFPEELRVYRQKRIGIYYRSKTWNITNCKNAISDVDT